MRASILFTFYFFLFTSAFALTRAEIVERFKAPPAINTDGLIQVIANCPSDMRREFQLPVASFAGDTCKALYAAEAMHPRRFAEPGIVIHIGEMRTNVTNVVSRVHTRGGVPYTKIYLPAPGYSDRQALLTAVTRAYFLAVHNETIDEATAWTKLLASNPEFKSNITCQRIANWSERGIYESDMDDEAYLHLARKVLRPGHLTRYERDHFAARLFLYPLAYDAPFCGRYTSIDFPTAIRLRDKDVRIRFAALVKARQLLIFGAGRGPGLQDAAEAYSLFLNELSRDEKTEGELTALLATAESKLTGALE